MTILRGHGSVEKRQIRLPRSLVGASLLAMAACQLASRLNVQSLSRASSIPQELAETALSFSVWTLGVF
ncbi:hypothetical protein F7R20_09565 [Pseudomonas brassicacearum subsp. brassicacearum]|nr:hypothetical protein F7R20_09565 [Pseudomonas brassicacearum subsp. brassicacearum]QEO80638.1 hypothetical protein ELZ14_24975 [Pseudomonas brassicacearum]